MFLFLPHFRSSASITAFIIHAYLGIVPPVRPLWLIGLEHLSCSMLLPVMAICQNGCLYCMVGPLVLQKVALILGAGRVDIGARLQGAVDVGRVMTELGRGVFEEGSSGHARIHEIKT